MTRVQERVIAKPVLALVREPGGPDGQGRERFVMFWSGGPTDGGSTGNRAQHYHAVVSEWLAKGVVECSTEAEAKRVSGWKPEVYTTSYCNHGHVVATGKPVDHKCRVLPTAALQAERDGNYEKAIDLLAKGKRRR